MHEDTAHRCSPMHPYGEQGVKVRSHYLQTSAPACIGTLTSNDRLCHAFADGTLLPVIAGGSVDTVEVEKPTLLTVPEFCAEIRVAVSTGWAMVKSGEIPSIVVGQKSRRITRADLNAYVAARRAEVKA